MPPENDGAGNLRLNNREMTLIDEAFPLGLSDRLPTLWQDAARFAHNKACSLIILYSPKKGNYMATTSAAETNGIDVDTLGDNIARYWWGFFLRGLTAIGFGIIAVAWPVLTLAALIIFFGSYAFVDGIFLIGGTIPGWGRLQNRWLPMLEGFLGIVVGVLTFINPAITAIGLLIYIAAWSLATGAIEIASAIELRKNIKGEIWLLHSASHHRICFHLMYFLPPEH